MCLHRLFGELFRGSLVVLTGLAVASVCFASTAITPAVTASGSHGLSLNASGSACAAGQNEYGELGDGTAVTQSTPVPIAYLTGALAGVATGTYHSLAVKTDGTVWSWGYNGYGELGTGNTATRYSPMAILGLSNVTAVAAGEYHSLALTSSGLVYAWGYNGYGQLGDGTITERTSPVPVIQLTNVVAISAGLDFSLAVKSDGTVWAWGYNADGELGNGTTTNASSPIQVTGLSGVTQVAAGSYHGLALTSGGAVWAWGYGVYGELGNGANTSQLNVVKAAFLTSATAIAASGYHSLAVQGGGVWAWGYNDDGQLGNGTKTNANVPTQAGTTVSNFTGIVAVAGGTGANTSYNFSLAIEANGTVWSWGDNTYGELGVGNSNQSSIPVQQLACVPTPTVGPPESAFITRISANQNQGNTSLNFGLAARSDGTVWGWGDNSNGQLGDGTSVNRFSPVQASGVTGAVDVAAGGAHSLAVTSSGSVWSWGYNGYGQLGSGTTSNRSIPFAISNFTGAVAVSAGYLHSLALKNDGTVWSFGYNGQGQLGNGTTTESTRPVQAIGLTNMVAIAAGYDHSLALRNDGTVWAWGDNSYGELGNGTTTQASSAVPVAGLTNVTAIAASNGFDLALRSDGTVWAWGYNANGQLGDGDTTSQSTIVRVSGLTGVVAIAAGTYHALAVKSDGTVWAWGYNNTGQLGDANTVSSTVPTQVIGLTGALAVAAGPNFSLALTTNGLISGWGSNSEGQFSYALPASSTVYTTNPSPDAAFPIMTVYQLTTAVSGSGSVTISPASSGNYYVSGSTACLAATPGAGQIFTGWTGGSASSISANCVIMTANASVTANFAANPVTAASALRFVPVAPCRLVDTRGAAGPLGGPSVGAGDTRSFTIPGTCGIPTSALAYSLNLTVVPKGTLGYISMWPTGQSQPTVSTLNSIDGRVKSNAAIVPGGTGGGVSVFATNTTDVILDINGYFDSFTDPSALQFYPLTPCRIADTRNAAGALGGPSLIGGAARIVPVMSSSCGIPGNALAYSLNFTAIPQGPLGYLTVWPNAQSQPGVSTLNAPTGVVTANAAIVPAGTAGAIELFVTDNTDMAIDINGYFASPGSGGLSLYNLTPCRIEDSRSPLAAGAFTGTIAVTATGVPCGIPPEAKSLVLNATVIPSGVLGYLTLWANFGSQPVVSTLNAVDGSLTSNMALVPTSNGLVNAYGSGPGATYLILDTSGYFAP